ncbi:MAG: flavin reductase family protein [Lysinibacillus sp.]
MTQHFIHTEQITAFKQALGNYPTGVTVVTTFNENNEPIGLTVNSFASVSINPLLILWSIDKNTKSYNEFMVATKFAVNILASEQAAICNLFASKVPDRFSQVAWETSAHQLPVLQETLSVLQCEKAQAIDAGDHTIFIGHVIQIDNADKQPLLYHQRKVGQIPPSFYE